MLLSSIPQDTRILFLEYESYKEGACVLTLEYDWSPHSNFWLSLYEILHMSKVLYFNKCVVTWDNWHIIELFLGTNIFNPPVYSLTFQMHILSSNFIDHKPFISEE